MKKIISTIFITSLFILVPNVSAQMMSRFSNSATEWEEIVNHTIREEQEGKKIWDALQTKEQECANLSDEQFGMLGEYFMGQMTGDPHAAMNAMMIQMHGKKGEEQIHIVMGKRLSGCDISASTNGIGGGWMPMMNMLAPYGTAGSRPGMWGGWSSPFNSNQSNPKGVASRPYGASNSMMNSMMGFGFMPWGGFGWIFMIFWWVLIIMGVVALIKWLTSQSRGSHDHEKLPLDILKERYAKGEIDKKEFEEKKKDLS